LAHDFPPRKVRFNESPTGAKADAPGGLWDLRWGFTVTPRFGVVEWNDRNGATR